LQLRDMLQQVHRLVLLVVDEEEVVLLNLVSHQKENESKERADRHSDGEQECHRHDSEREGLVVTKLKEPVVFVRSVPCPVDKC